MRSSGNHPVRPDKTKRRDNFVLLIWIFIMLVVTGLGVFFWYRFLRPDNKPSQSATLSVAGVDSQKLNASEKQAYDTTQKFLDYVKSQNNAEAFKLFSDVLKNQYKGGVEDFSNQTKTSNLQNINKWAIANVEMNGNKDRITVKGSAVFSTPNPKAKFEFSYYKDADGNFRLYSWQVYPET